MTQMAPEIVDLSETVGDIEIPCDYAEGSREHFPTCDGSMPARWAMFTKDHGCGVHVRLACDTCKEKRLMNVIAVECVHCLHIDLDSATAYARIEAL